ncbi:MAG: hypothetical protein COB08_017005 [Rhodobacteraceae bacterium]|nr:hypothetical protein [Paracoccaceae bacterium]
MKNKMKDLTNHLFAQLERLGEEDLTPEQIATECDRSKAIVSVAGQLVANGDLQLKAAKLYAEHGDKLLPMLPQIGGKAE